VRGERTRLGGTLEKDKVSQSALGRVVVVALSVRALRIADALNGAMLIKEHRRTQIGVAVFLKAVPIANSVVVLKDKHSVMIIPTRSILMKCQLPT
jgi:hypothetical protein